MPQSSLHAAVSISARKDLGMAHMLETFVAQCGQGKVNRANFSLSTIMDS